ncbi:oligomeric Golgi complex subunit 6 [Infundibulicybe gibba]|nr:oligomeric Golgi complex subunit 6 [Infundibulicybe gibba]
MDRNKSWAAQTRNPVTSRLYKVLGTNFEDDATREALWTLSDMYSGSGTSGARQNFEHEGANGEDGSQKASTHRRADDCNEQIPGELASRARKNLRRDMETRLAEGSNQFLAVLGDLDQILDTLQEHTGAMRKSCDDAEEQLRLTGDASKIVLERAGSLREERRQVEMRRSIVTLFLSRFTLSNDEVEALTSRDVPLGKRFFQAMDKTERIRHDCRLLMAGEDGPTQSGTDIMASTASQLEQAYAKIFRWCSNEFRSLGPDSILEVSSIMREAIRRLKSRQELLTEALTFLSQARQATLLSSFLAALTRGGPSGLPRPIELHAHDPMRYVGDMLAWVHQAIAAEREFLEGLFGLKNDGRMVGSVRKFDGESEEEDWIRELMDLAVGKLCVPLKMRIQQTVRSQESSIVSYKIANLLQFYYMTMRRTIGDQAILSVSLNEMTDLAYKVFYESIETRGRALLRIPLELDDKSLSPPPVVVEHIQIFREILAVYQSSLGDEEKEERIVGFQRILDTMIDPVVEMCFSAGAAKKQLRAKWDEPIYVLNCLSYLQSVLDPFPFTHIKHKLIQDLITEKASTLTEEHYTHLLRDAGLQKFLENCQNRTTNEPLSRIPNTQASDLQASLRNFSLWLSGPEVVQSPRLSHLSMQRLHHDIHHAALARLARSYQVICDEVKKAENRYEAGATLLGTERPFGQIHLLWQIFGLDGESTK